MMLAMSDLQGIFNSLKDEGPQAWRAYLRPFEEGEGISGLSMLIIYPHAADLAKNQGSLDWAEVAVRAAELQARTHTGISREEALLMAMRLRAWFISKMGSRPSDLILDKAIIFRWAMDGVDISVQTAEEKAASIGKRLVALRTSSTPEDKQQVGADLSLLRRMKHRLNVVKVLADCSELPGDSPLSKWLEIRQLLP
jgi:hypothetical protein